MDLAQETAYALFLLLAPGGPHASYLPVAQPCIGVSVDAGALAGASEAG